jgi:hypothetical protein
MEKDKIKKIIRTSLGALVLGCIFFIFGLSIKSTFLLLINYFLAMGLFISALFALHNNNKEKINILTYLQYLTLFMIVFITFVVLHQILL